MSELMLCNLCNGLFENIRQDLKEDQIYVLEFIKGLGAAARCHCGHIGNSTMIHEREVKGVLVVIPMDKRGQVREGDVIEIFKKGESLIPTLRMLSALGVNCCIWNHEKLESACCGKFKFHITYN